MTETFTLESTSGAFLIPALDGTEVRVVAIALDCSPGVGEVMIVDYQAGVNAPVLFRGCSSPCNASVIIGSGGIGVDPNALDLADAVAQEVCMSLPDVWWPFGLRVFASFNITSGTAARLTYQRRDTGGWKPVAARSRKRAKA